MVGVHGEKLTAALESEKLPKSDIPRINKAIEAYNKWISELNNTEAESTAELVTKMVDLLNNYKNYIELNLIFDSPNDFLYRQKGQLKLDNTILEEFLPILVKKCIELNNIDADVEISSQNSVYSSLFFESNLSSPGIGGTIKIKTKDQDFSMSRVVYLRSSYKKDFPVDKTETVPIHLGYIMAELKTNLDKTMFQEACATAHDVKLAVTGAKYFLLCEYLDMKPISSTTTDIEEVLILRKSKRMNSNIRKSYDTYEGRQRGRAGYVDHLNNTPFCADVFLRFIEYILIQFKEDTIEEKDVLETGYF